MQHSLLFGVHRQLLYGILLGLILIEAIWSWIHDRENYNVKESLANTVIFFGYITSKIFTAGYTVAVLTYISRYAFFHLPSTALIFIITLVATDFCYYWYHRISHNVKFFWAFHLVHHSSQWMNFTTAYRLNWFSALITPYFFIPAVMFGLPPVYIALSFGINLLYQFFMHTEAIKKIPLIEGIIDTPSAHRVHHGRNDIYIDKNYGGIFMVWDRIFGTYQPETEPVKYGITTGFVSYNPFKLIFHGFTDLLRGKMNYKG